MLMVGLLAGTAFRRHVLVPPLAFVASMLMGFGYGAVGGMLPITELLILASLVMLGGMLLFELRAPLAVASAMIALFAFAHGHAHGAELPAGASALHFASGFVLTTALLHGLGIGIAMALNRPATRWIGGGIAAFGTIALFAT